MKDDFFKYQIVKEIIKWAKFIKENGGVDIRIAKSYPVPEQPEGENRQSAYL